MPYRSIAFVCRPAGIESSRAELFAAKYACALLTVRSA